MMNIEGSSLVTISCAEHSQYVAMALRNLFDAKRGTDFNLRLGGNSVSAHRLILELFLAPELTGTVQDDPSFATAVKQEVPDDGYGSGRNILDFVVEFLYKGEVAVPEQLLEDLLGVAKELNFQMLIDAVQVCRPVNIFAEDELNFNTNSEINYTENVNQLEGLLEPRIEDVKYNIDTLDNTGSMHLDLNRELTLGPCFLNMGTQILHGAASQDQIANSRLLQLQPKYIKLESDIGSEDSQTRLDVAESLSDVLPNSDSNEDDDGGAARDVSSYSGTSSGPRKNKTNICKAPKVYKCPHCDFSTPNYQQNVSHLLKIHGLTARSMPTPMRKCPNCEFETLNVSKFRNHCLTAHQLTMRGEPAPLHKCPKCDYSTVYYGSIKLHLSTVHSQERSHPCPQCSYAGKQKTNLKQHLFLVHGVGDSLVTCKVCRKHFMSPSALERHSRIHTNERPFKCLLCSYAAKQMGELKSHMSIIHSEGDSCLTCEVCKKRCRSLVQMKLHSRVHTNERPFKCRLCSYAAKLMGNLKKHMRAIHRD